MKIKNKEVKILLAILLIILSVLVILLINALFGDKTTRKNIKLELIDVNFLKRDECYRLDYYGIDAITPEIFMLRDCDFNNNYILVNKDEETLDNELSNDHVVNFDNMFIYSQSHNGGEFTSAKVYDKKGGLKLTADRLIYLSENLLLITEDEAFSTTGKLYNIKESKYSEEYELLQYVNDNAILVKDDSLNLKIINSKFDDVKNFGNINDNIIILNEDYVFNETNGKIINLKNSDEINSIYDEYYPLYNEYIEVCNNELCGVINIENDKIIVPLNYDDTFIEFEYADIDSIGSKMFNVENKIIIVDDKDVYNFSGKKIIELENESYISVVNQNYYIIEEYTDDDTVKKIKVFDISGKITFEDTLYNSFFTEYSKMNKYIAYDNSENMKDSTYGIVDINGKFFREFEYDGIDIYDGFYVIRENGKSAIYNYDNEEILPFGNYEMEWQSSNAQYEIIMVENKDTDDIKMLVSTFN